MTITTERGTCPDCLKLVLLRADGRLRYHISRLKRNGYRSGECKGSRETPLKVGAS